MTIGFAFSKDCTSASNTLVDELKERMVALAERICALAEAANIVAEAAAPFKMLAVAAVDGEPAPPTAFTSADGINAFDQAARRLEAARIDAVNEFTTLRARLSSDQFRAH